MSEEPKYFEPTWESLTQFQVPEWYQDAKFGIFIHWGIFSVPAFDNEWYSRNMYLPGSRAFEHHREVWGPHSKFGYKDFIPLFKAENFDANRWIDLFKRAGARYIVPVAEHHDGFAMYDSALSRWTAAKMGPKRDVIGELAAAAREQGLIFGLSNHRAEHWWFMNGGRTFESDLQDPEAEDFYGPAQPGPGMDNPVEWDSLDWKPRPNAKYLEDWLARNQELIEKYQPQLYYFDWWIQQIVFEPYIQRFAAYYYNQAQGWGKEVLINAKHGAFPPGSAVFDMERGKLSDIRPMFWQTDTSISNNSWCFIDDQDYKTATGLIHDLIDIVSKNGTLLLNVGPRADGTIPEAEVEVLEAIGTWLDVNGEAIYETRPWKIFGEGPTKVVEGSFQETKQVGFTAADVRFTTRGKTLYAILLGQPEGQEICIESLGFAAGLYAQRIGAVSLLGQGSIDNWTQDDACLHVRLPAGHAQTQSVALTLKIEPE